MLYTTYFHKIHQLAPDVKKMIITRFPPKWLDVNEYPNTYIVKDLSPHPDILMEYKKDGDWGKYTERFNKQMKEDKDMVNLLELLEPKLLQGYDYALLCYERDYMRCHRYLIAKHLEARGVEWKEIWFNGIKVI